MNKQNPFFQNSTLLKKHFQISCLYRFCLVIVSLFIATCGFANHLKGGWIQYEYVGPGTTANSSIYTVTVKQYLDCGSTGQQRDKQVYLGIFDGVTGNFEQAVTIPLSGSDNPNKLNFSSCLNNPPVGKVCYIIDRYTTNLELPNNPNGYTLTVQRCCRIANIVNVGGNSSSIGVSYTNTIPGTINGTDYSKNSSPVFAQRDTAIVCFRTPFNFDFSATDKEGDSLSYSFCNGLTGGGSSSPQPNPPSTPPYSSVPYGNGFSGFFPLGPLVSIDPNTGIISGTAPSTPGDYIIAVCANEYRNGVLIGSTRKEIHITVADCSLSAAELKPTYIACNSFALSFQNESTNTNIASYLWDFGETKFPLTDTSTSATPTHNYNDTGVYRLKLVVTSTGGCTDSATATVKVFPGFTPDFAAAGNCYINSYQFLDKTVTKYGVVNSWRWDLGDLTTLADTATHKDTAWKYQTPQTAQVRLIVTNSKGCTDTISKPINILDKPSLNLAFKDTLICSIDTLQLRAAVGSGTISWTPDNLANKFRIINSTTNSPSVFPHDTTRYFVSLNDNGCINSDTVKVNVLQFISVKAGMDSGICQTDTFRLRPVSQALSYQWQSSTGEVVANIKYPLVQPLTSTRYYVTANLGKCQAIDSVYYTVSPYPMALVGADTMICYGSRVNLEGFVVGSSFSWTPTNTLLNYNTLNPIAGPTKTTRYVLTATNTIGCLKPVSDSILVIVTPLFTANAGRDTAVIAEQPLQLNATGGIRYSWTPATGLSNPNIANPVAILGSGLDSVTYKVTAYDTAGCSATDAVTVRVYKSQPEIFVPTAFTPDNDGKNDILKPITVGITRLHFFNVYNRWGQQVFTTTEFGKGWDGKLNGIAQASGTYVFITEGTDYLGNKVYRKGTTVLIR